MSNKKTVVGIIIVVILILTIGILVCIYNENNSEPNTQSNQQIDNTPEDQNQQEINETNTQAEDATETEKISFCEKDYDSDKVIINGTDVGKKIAEIAENETWLCKNIELGKFQESGIGIAQKEASESNSYLIDLFYRNDKKEQEDPFDQSPFIFKFDFKNNTVYYQNQFDGKFKILSTIK